MIIGAREISDSGHDEDSTTSMLEHGNCKRCGIGDRNEFLFEKTTEAKEITDETIKLKGSAGMYRRRVIITRRGAQTSVRRVVNYHDGRYRGWLEDLYMDLHLRRPITM